MAQELLKAGANYRCPELEYGGRILFWAEYDNNVELTRAALAAKVDPMICIPDQESLLIHAISRGHEEIAKELLTVDQNTEFKDFDGMTAMARAVDSESLAIITALAKAGADVNVRAMNYHKTPLLLAVELGDLEAVEILIEAGAHVNALGEKGNSALIIAARNGDLDCVRALIHAKAEIEVHNHDGDTALMVAVANDNIDVVEKLIDARADVHAHGFGNHTALFSAPTAEVAEALIAAHADVNAQDQMDSTALMIASQLRRSDVIYTLLEANAAVNAKNLTGMSALLYSLQTFNDELPHLDKDTVKALLKAKANLDGIDRDGHGALHLAVRNCESASILNKLLKACKQQVQAGVDVNAQTHKGTTPLMRAVVHDSASLPELLITDRADLDARDSYGLTALIKAADKVDAHSTKLLLDAGARWEPQHPAEISAFMDICSGKFVLGLLDKDNVPNQDHRRESSTEENINEENTLEVLQLLIAAKADVNQSLPAYYPPLRAASERPEVLRVLLEAGADVDGRGSDGETALMMAASAGARESVELLLDAKADVNAMDFEHQTPLKRALETGDIDMLRLLVAAGAQVELGYSAQSSPLKYCLTCSSPDEVRVLLQGKADVQKLTSRYDTNPLENAVTQNKVDVLKLLVNAGLDLSHTTKLAATLLSSAAARGHADMLRLLLDAKAFVDAVDPYNTCKTPLMTATMTRFGSDVLDVLLAAGAKIEACVSENGETALSSPNMVQRPALLKHMLRELCRQTGYSEPLEKIENTMDEAEDKDGE